MLPGDMVDSIQNMWFWQLSMLECLPDGFFDLNMHRSFSISRSCRHAGTRRGAQQGVLVCYDLYYCWTTWTMCSFRKFQQIKPAGMELHKIRPQNQEIKQSRTRVVINFCCYSWFLYAITFPPKKCYFTKKRRKLSSSKDFPPNTYLSELSWCRVMLAESPRGSCVLDWAAQKWPVVGFFLMIARHALMLLFVLGTIKMISSWESRSMNHLACRCP